MPVAYSADDVRTRVRLMLHTRLHETLTDDLMNVTISQGLARLNEDEPREQSTTITGTGAASYRLDTLAGWTPYFSTVKGLYIPDPKPNTDDLYPMVETYQRYRVYERDSQWWIAMETALATGDTILLVYTRPWTIADIDEESTTTVPYPKRAPLEYITASLAALTLSAKAASTIDRQIPADLIDYRRRADEYRRVAIEWEHRYLHAMNLSSRRNKAVSVWADSRDTLQDGQPYVTHWGR